MKQSVITIAVIVAIFGVAPHRQAAAQSNAPSTQFSQTDAGAEDKAWDSAVKNGTVDAYLAFAREHPKSERIKVQTGTVRGRYWYKMAMPFGPSGNADKSESGVLVTVEGMTVLKNVSLEEAKVDKLLEISPATKRKEIKAKGQTFNWTCVEVSSGGCVVKDELIAPKDSIGALVVLSGDGKSLLAWDVKNAKTAAQPDENATYIKTTANDAWLPKP
ncbi:MAG: hypothetical protein ABSH14_11940 [Verrucomicrobiia bacterium]